MDRNNDDDRCRDDRAPQDDRDQRAERGPDMRAYTVIDRGQDQKPFWREIGSAHHHEDGKGMTVHADALPRDGKIVLREQRREEFKEQRREGQSRSRERSQERDQSRER